MNFKNIIFILFSICFGKSIILTSNNHLSIVGTIDDNIVNDQIEKSITLDKKSNYTYIYINSPGGSVMAGQRFINLINSIKNKKKILCIADTAASMAFHIYQYCDFRYVIPNSKLMQHQISISGLEGNLKNIKNYITMVEEMNNMMITIESNRLKIQRDIYEKKIESDWWIYGGEKIVKAGVADSTIDYIMCSEQLIKKKIITLDIFNTIINKSVCPLIS